MNLLAQPDEEALELFGVLVGAGAGAQPAGQQITTGVNEGLEEFAGAGVNEGAVQLVLRRLADRAAWARV